MSDLAIEAGYSAEEQQIIEATETAEAAQAQGSVATEAAIQANETAEAAAGVAVVAGSVAVETADEAGAIAEGASVQAAEAQQEAATARTETGELREEIRGMFSSLETRPFPPEQETTESGNGVEELNLDDADIGESGNPGECEGKSDP